MHLTTPVIPALANGQHLGRGEKVEVGLIYKTPMLIPTATPIFSRSFIVRPQITRHAMPARTKSMTVEYTIFPVSVNTARDGVQGFTYWRKTAQSAPQQTRASMNRGLSGSTPSQRVCTG